MKNGLLWVALLGIGLMNCGTDDEGTSDTKPKAPDAGGVDGHPGDDASAHGGSGGAAGAGGASAGAAGHSTAGSGGTGTSGAGGSAGSAAGTGGSSGQGAAAGANGDYLASQYPGDKGIENDPAVVWVENFEEGSVDALVARYNDAKKNGLTLDAQSHPNSIGKASGKFTANGSGPQAVDLYKNFGAGYDELFVRYYVKYGSGAQWHHTGVWLGGYAPPSNWPSPQAGLKPEGNDRFHISFETMGSSPNPRLDFYNYWMKMHSWKDNPTGSDAYYGNTIVHQKDRIAYDNQWMCVEIHLKLNTDPASSQGAELGLWIDDQSVIQFNDSSPQGCWIKDKFCPQTGPVADDPSCTDYPNLCKKPYVPLDLQFRSTTDLRINAFWPQNYITEGGAGTVWYDDMVLARSRIGCIP